MPKMRAVQVSQPNGPFEIVEKEIPTPSFGRVRIKIQACGICHSDSIFNALSNSVTRLGDTVAVLGIGGLGHLAVQFCSKMGFNTVAIARGRDKEALAKQLGAKHYIDSQSDDVVKELQKFGGAKVILSTVTQNDAVSAVVDGLSNEGQLIIVGVPFEPIHISAL